MVKALRSSPVLAGANTVDIHLLCTNWKVPLPSPHRVPIEGVREAGSVTPRPLGCHSDRHKKTAAVRSSVVVSSTPSPSTTPTPCLLFRAAFSTSRRHWRPTEFHHKLSVVEPRDTTTITAKTSQPNIPFTSLQDELVHVMVFLLAQRQAVKRRCIVIHKRGLFTPSIVTSHRDASGRLQQRFPCNERTRLRKWPCEILIPTWEGWPLRLRFNRVRSDSHLHGRLLWLMLSSFHVRYSLVHDNQPSSPSTTHRSPPPLHTHRCRTHGLDYVLG